MLDEQKSRGWEFRGIARAGESSSTAPRALFIIAVSSRERSPLRAEVAELADAQASGACGRKVVEVQILSSAPVLLLFSSVVYRDFLIPRRRRVSRVRRVCLQLPYKVSASARTALPLSEAKAGWS